jgi:uncharacterized protein (TIGR03118 family)
MLRAKSRRPSFLASARPRLEVLENRCLMSADVVPNLNVMQTNLVSDLSGVALLHDSHLVNPWGIADSPTVGTKPGGPFWISDNNGGVSTLYSSNPGANPPIPTQINGLVVGIPTPIDPKGMSGTPTGIVFNTDTSGFKLPAPNGKPASFIFATEDGTIVAWNGGTEATIVVDNSGNNFTNPDPNKETGAVYKGLALATDPNGQSLLYATNFRTGQIDVFDASFQPATNLAKDPFTDPDLPKDYAPFNIQELGGKLYVTYARQDKTRHDDAAGPHRGFVDVFNLDGSPGLSGGAMRLVSRGPLDSPWGLAIAPSTFGNLGGALLVGNFGNGHINAFNATTGDFLGALTDPDGEPLQIDGLWALKVGNGGKGGDAGTVYFTAGLDHETHGLFGSLTSVAPNTSEGLAESQKVTAALDVFQINLQTVQQDLANGVAGATLRQDLKALNTSLVELIQAEVRFAADSRHDQGDDGGGTSSDAAASALAAVFADLHSLDRDLG